MDNTQTTPSQSANPLDDFIIKVFPVGPLQCNCTIIGHKPSGDALLFDPGGDGELILQTLTENNLTVKKILHTHAHFDHFLAAGHIKQKTEAPLCLHKDDEYLWTHLEEQCARYAIPFEQQPPPDHWIEHEEELSITGCMGQCIHTPGHTPGSTSFWFESLKILVAGDTLFQGSIGRTDLWGGDYTKIEDSIKTRLYTLDEEATVVTGHGQLTSIGHELRHNQFIRG